MFTFSAPLLPKRLSCFVVCCLSLLFAGRSITFGADTPRPVVLVVQSYHEGMEWTDAVSTGLKEGLADKAELVFHYLDIKRFPPGPRRAHLEAGLTEVITRTKPTLFISVDDYAYAFTLQMRDRLTPETPIVFAGVNYWAGPHPRNVTGVMEAADLEGTVSLAFSLHPRAKRLVVVNDITETGKANRAAVDAIVGRFPSRTFHFIGSGSFRETENALANLSASEDIVLLLSWNLDDTGKARGYPEAIAKARSLCPSPIYGVWSFYFGHGIVGGMLMEGRVHGIETAGLATQYLAGIPASAINIVTKPKSTLLLDARELRRFQIPEDSVPLKAEIRFQETSLWQRYRNTILLVIIVVTFQAVSIFWLAIMIIRRRSAERRLRLSEEHLRKTLDSIQDAVITADTHEIIRMINPVATQLTGWSGNEAVGRKVRDVFDLAKQGSNERGSAPTSVALDTGAVVRSLAIEQLRAKEGVTKPISYSAAPIRDDKGKTTGVVLAFRDVSYHVKLEEQLRQSQKIESLGLLAGGVAHDFNNILMAINGNLELMSDPTLPKEDAAECLKEVVKAAQRATGLTQQLLAFGRRQKLAPKNIDLADLTGEVLKMVKRLLPPNISIGFDAPTNKFWANVDGAQIEQVIMNLCNHAKDSMASGGKIDVSLSLVNFSEEDTMLGSWIRPGRYVMLAFADSGKGIPREVLDHLFEPFAIKGAGRGTGLGLAVIQGIVHQHKGLINVYSEEKRGTVFRIYLPAIDSGSAPAATSAASSRVVASSHKGAQILVAEEDSAVRMAMSTILRRAGFRVLSAANGEEACQLCAEQGTAVALAILDASMPRLSGIDAAKTIVNRNPSISVILCTGHPAAIDPDLKCFWMKKPYTSTELLEEIEKSLSSKP